MAVFSVFPKCSTKIVHLQRRKVYALLHSVSSSGLPCVGCVSGGPRFGRLCGFSGPGQLVERQVVLPPLSPSGKVQEPALAWVGTWDRHA